MLMIVRGSVRLHYMAVSNMVILVWKRESATEQFSTEEAQRLAGYNLVSIFIHIKVELKVVACSQEQEAVGGNVSLLD